MTDFAQFDQTYTQALTRARLIEMFRDDDDDDDRDLLADDSQKTTIAQLMSLSPDRNPIEYQTAVHFQLLANLLIRQREIPRHYFITEAEASGQAAAVHKHWRQP